MKIETEYKKVEKVILAFEQKVKAYISDSLSAAVVRHPDITIVMQDGYVSIFDYVDAEQVVFNVYFGFDEIEIEVTKNGERIGELEKGSDAYIRYASIVKPIKEVYDTYLEWDGQDFLQNLLKRKS